MSSSRPTGSSTSDPRAVKPAARSSPKAHPSRWPRRRAATPASFSLQYSDSTRTPSRDRAGGLPGVTLRDLVLKCGEDRERGAILRPVRDLFGADDVGEGRDRHDGSIDLYLRCALNEVVVALAAGGAESDVEVTEPRGEIHEIHVSEEVRIHREGNAVRFGTRTDPRSHFAHCNRKSLEILGRRVRADVGVVRQGGGTVERRGEAANEDVVDVMVRQRVEELLRLEGLRHGRARDRPDVPWRGVWRRCERTRAALPASSRGSGEVASDRHHP